MKVKPAHIPTMIELLLLGAKDSYVNISTVDLAKRIGKSQQAISKHLSDLEWMGYIERLRVGGRNGVRVTVKGVEAAMEFYNTLKSVFEGVEPTLKIEGELFTGLGEGAYYMSLRGYRKQFVRKLGFDPYPGTLNLLLSPADRRIKRELEAYLGIQIEGFEDEQRTYGWARCYPAKVNDTMDAMVIILERTHYDDSVIEVVSPLKIREALKLKDGERVTVKIYPSKASGLTSRRI